MASYLGPVATAAYNVSAHLAAASAYQARSWGSYFFPVWVDPPPGQLPAPTVVAAATDLPGAADTFVPAAPSSAARTPPTRLSDAGAAQQQRQQGDQPMPVQVLPVHTGVRGDDPAAGRDEAHADSLARVVGARGRGNGLLALERDDSTRSAASTRSADSTGSVGSRGSAGSDDSVEVAPGVRPSRYDVAQTSFVDWAFAQMKSLVALIAAHAKGSASVTLRGTMQPSADGYMVPTIQGDAHARVMSPVGYTLTLSAGFNVQKGRTAAGDAPSTNPPSGAPMVLAPPEVAPDNEAFTMRLVLDSPMAIDNAAASLWGDHWYTRFADRVSSGFRMTSADLDATGTLRIHGRLLLFGGLFSVPMHQVMADGVDVSDLYNRLRAPGAVGSQTADKLGRLVKALTAMTGPIDVRITSDAEVTSKFTFASAGGFNLSKELTPGKVHSEVTAQLYLQDNENHDRICVAQKRHDATGAPYWLAERKHALSRSGEHGATPAPFIDTIAAVPTLDGRLEFTPRDPRVAAQVVTFNHDARRRGHHLETGAALSLTRVPDGTVSLGATLLWNMRARCETTVASPGGQVVSATLRRAGEARPHSLPGRSAPAPVPVTARTARSLIHHDDVVAYSVGAPAVGLASSSTIAASTVGWVKVAAMHGPAPATKGVPDVVPEVHARTGGGLSYDMTKPNGNFGSGSHDWLQEMNWGGVQPPLRGAATLAAR